MAQSSLRVKPRKRIGKSGARQVRKEGNIPAVLYGLGMDPLSLVVEPDALKTALSGNAGINTVLELEIDDPENPDKKLSMLKEVQRDPLKNKAIHIDFLAIDMSRPVIVPVPVNTNGRSEGERKGGKLERLMRSVNLECLPSDIPDSIEIDVRGLDIGDSVDIADLDLAEGVKPLPSAEEKVVHVLAQKSTEAEEEDLKEQTEEAEETESDE